VVGESADIEVAQLEFIEPTIAKLTGHRVRIEDVERTLTNAPEFVHNLPGRSGTHVMLGPDSRGRFFYVVLIATLEAGVWRVVTGYPYDKRRALRNYRGGAR
jgi:hypothetical protein